MSPLKIKILLHYYSTAGQYNEGEFDAPAIREAIDEFVQLGLLKRDPPDSMCSRADGILTAEERYKATDGVKIYVETLEAVPLPVLKWVMPEPEEVMT